MIKFGFFLKISTILLFILSHQLVKGEITVYRIDYLGLNAACPKTTYTDGYWINVESRFKAYELKITGGTFIDKGVLKESIVIRESELYQGQSRIYISVIWNNTASKNGKAPIGNISVNGYNSEFLTQSNIIDKGKRDQEIKSLKDIIPPSLISSSTSSQLPFGEQSVRVYLSGAFNYPGIKVNGFPVPVTKYEWQIPEDWTASSGSVTLSGTYLTSIAEIKLITDASSGGEIKVRGINDCPGSDDYSVYSWPITFTRKAGIEFLDYPESVAFGEARTYKFSVMKITGVSYEWYAPNTWSINGGGNTFTGGNVVQITSGRCPTNYKVRVRMVLDNDYSEWAEFPTAVKFPAINTPSEITQYQPVTFSLNMPDDEIETVEWLVNGSSVGIVNNTSTLSFPINKAGIVNISSKIKLMGCTTVVIPEVEVEVEKAPDPVINGPSLVCDEATYIIEGLEYFSDNTEIYWSTSSDLVILSGQGTSSVVVSKNNSSKNGYINAKITLDNESLTISKTGIRIGTELLSIAVYDSNGMYQLAPPYYANKNYIIKAKGSKYNYSPDSYLSWLITPPPTSDLLEMIYDGWAFSFITEDAGNYNFDLEFFNSEECGLSDVVSSNIFFNDNPNPSQNSEAEAEVKELKEEP